MHYILLQSYASCIIHTTQEPFAVSQLHSLLNLLCTSWDHSPVAWAFWSIFVTLASACTGLDGPKTNKVQRNFQPPRHVPSNSVYSISMDYIDQVQSSYRSGLKCFGVSFKPKSKNGLENHHLFIQQSPDTQWYPEPPPSCAASPFDVYPCPP